MEKKVKKIHHKYSLRKIYLKLFHKRRKEIIHISLNQVRINPNQFHISHNLAHLQIKSPKSTSSKLKL
jgi:hypothetical protein